MAANWIERRSPKTRTRIAQVALSVLLLAAVNLVVLAAVGVAWSWGLTALFALPLGLAFGTRLKRSRASVRSNGVYYFTAFVAVGVVLRLDAVTRLAVWACLLGLLAAILVPFITLQAVSPSRSDAERPTEV